MAGLGERLHAARTMRGESLRAVAGPAEVSPAYLQKLEAGKVESPSPHVLQRLAEVLDLSYATLMRLAGYKVPGAETSPSTSLGGLLASTDLDDDELAAVAAFVSHLREQRQ